jgi:GrpB-like predicted nucleotidyltransferase (UPF0157 family)
MAPEEIEACGLGLPKGVVRLERVVPGWRTVATALIAEITAALGTRAAGVEHIGSTAVQGLLAKPIIDIAVLLASDAAVDGVVTAIEGLGYEFRGDAGNAGGLVFVLNVRPDHRVAHVHVLPSCDEQWDQYLSFRGRLRSDAGARASYEAAKVALASKYHNNRKAYTDGKEDIIRRLRR